MPLPKETKTSVTKIMKLLDQLSPKEQAEVRQTFLEDEEDLRVSLYRLKHPAKYISQEQLEKKLGLAD